MSQGEAIDQDQLASAQQARRLGPLRSLYGPFSLHHYLSQAGHHEGHLDVLRWYALRVGLSFPCQF